MLEKGTGDDTVLADIRHHKLESIKLIDHVGDIEFLGLKEGVSVLVEIPVKFEKPSKK